MHGKGLEIVTVSLELSGPEASRGYIEAAHAEHPSLLDPTHQLDTLFGVVNIPNVIWIDEHGTIVRPPEPGWPDSRQSLPENLRESLPQTGTAPNAPKRVDGPAMMNALGSGQDRTTYADAVRDWAAKGSESELVLGPAEVIARSEPRPLTASEGAAHFELANHLWRSGQRELAIEHFKTSHRLQPDNWTYKRQAWSLLGAESNDGPYARFVQAPLVGEEAAWPYDSDFMSDVSMLEPGRYYPKTL